MLTLLRTKRKWVLAGLIVLAVVGIVETWRFYSAYTNLTEARTELTAGADVLRGKGLDVTPQDLEVARGHFSDAESKLSSARTTFEYDPFLFVGRHLPWASTQINGARSLTKIGHKGAQMGLTATLVVDDYQEVRSGSSQAPLGEKASALLESTREDMAALKSGLAVIDAERATLPEAGLLSPLDDARLTLDENLAYLRDQVELYDQASVILPEILGLNEQRRFLLLSQDNTELFPTGGLISVYGVLTLDKGRIADMRFSNAVLLGAERLRTGEYVQPPGPIERYLLRDWSWNLGTSNWSPDFPTAAVEAMRFLDKAGEGPVDGVIATNFVVLEELLRVLGPISLPEYGVTVTADNATEIILEQSHNARAQVEGRHVFPSRVADRVFNGVLTAPADKWTGLLNALSSLAKERHIFLYTRDVTVENAITGLGWDGGFAAEGRAGDYLMLVDTSVLSSKLNLILEQRIDLTIRLAADGTATHRVTVNYHNPFPEWSRGKSAVLQSQMLDGFYGDYLRAFVPAGSTLIDVQHNDRTVSVEDFGEELGLVWFGSFFTVPSGESTKVSLSYATPGTSRPVDGAQEYQLYLQKQSGTESLPLNLDLYLPEGATLLSATLDGKPLPNLAIDTDLKEDRVISVRYRVESVSNDSD